MISYPLRAPPFASALILAALVTACDAAPRGRDELQRWSLEPDLRIGELDGPNALGEVLELEVGDEGEVYVVEWNEGAVRVFDEGGRFVRRIGRSGGGPGEFTFNAGRLMWRGDTLIASDPVAGRLHLFRRDGHVIETIAPRPPPVPDHLGPFGPATLLADGSVLGSFGLLASRLESVSTLGFPIVRMERQAAIIDTLLLLSARTTGLMIMLGGGGIATRQPVSDDPLWAVTHDGAALIVVERDASAVRQDASYQVTKIDLAGDTVFSRAFAYTPVAVAGEISDSIVERLARRLSGSGRHPLDELRAAIREHVYLPPHLPPVTLLIAGRDGTIWLRREGHADSVEWDVLDDAGEPLARLAAPVALVVHRADAEQVWGVLKDELDVSYVIRYRVTGARL